MAVEFLDSPSVKSAGASKTGLGGTSGVTDAGGVEWLDAPAAQGVEFIDQAGEAASPAEINQRFLDPSYEPTLAEFKIFDSALKSRSVGQRVEDFASSAGNAAAGLADVAWQGVKGLGQMAVDPEANDPVLTVWEGVKRGTIRDLELARKLLPDELFGSGRLNFDQYAASQVAAANAQKFRYTPLTPENHHTLIKVQDVPPDVISKWRQEYDAQYLPENAYKRFLDKRQAVREQIASAQEKISAVNPAAAELTSFVASPAALVPFGRALSPVKTVSRAIAARTLEGAGKTFEWIGEKTVQAGTFPERAAGAAARAISGTEEAAAKATEVVATGVAGVSMAPVKAAGKTITSAGEAAAAVGRQAAQGPSRYGLLDRIAKDAQAPQWLRRVASVARPADPLLAAGAIATKGAMEGAAVGTTFGGLAEGEEGAASGFGAGLAFGAGGSLVGRALSGARYRHGLEEMDLARWLASKSDADVQKISSLNLTREQALALADTERMARGVRTPGEAGDVEFFYLTDKEFSEKFGIAKGAQVVEGDRPVVFVNTGYKGPRSVFHEIMHALDALDGSAPHRQRLNRVLFDQTLPDGAVVSKGLYSADDLAKFTSQYRSRLNEAARAEFDLLGPEDKQARILAEVRSEAFANLIAGRPASAFPGNFRSVRQRVADSLLAAEHDSMLGKMRRALELAGVRFTSSGAPSELFVRNGRPITNTPSVDAALRDYLRAKDNVTRRLNAAEDESPAFVVTPEDLVRNRALVDVFKDSDMFAKNPDGSVKVAVKPEDVAKLETQERAAIKASRDAEAAAESARKSADDAGRAIAAAEARAIAAERAAAASKTREAIAEAKAERVKWREVRRRGELQRKEALARERAAKAQAAASKAETKRLSNAKLSAGVPVLLTEREIQAIQAKRVDAMIEALIRTPNIGEVDVVKLKENGAFEGKFFSDRQLAALQALPDDILSPSMKQKLVELNAVARLDGAQVILDYNAALRSRRYSSGIAPTTRAAVPLTFNISKAGNFYMTTLDTTHFARKLADWRRTKPKAFAPWGGDVDAFVRDTFAYLDNHVNGRRGSVNLDGDAATAELKKNVINDFFNVPKGNGNEDLNPVQLSTRGDKDNLIRSRRFDRINLVTPGAGDRFPIRYELQKRNFLPVGAPIGSGLGVQKHIRAQSTFDLQRKMPAPQNLSEWVAGEYFDALDRQLNRGSRQPRAQQLNRVAQVARETSAAEMGTAVATMSSSGRNGAKAHLDRVAAKKAAYAQASARSYPGGS